MICKLERGKDCNNSSVPDCRSSAMVRIVIEGINTIKQVKQQADKLGVYMPIVSGLYEVIYNEQPIAEVAAKMMNSGQRSDVEFVLPNR